LVRRGLASDLDSARAEIDTGRVTVGGAPTDNPARLVSKADPIVVLGAGPRFVSRGGEKLDAALARFEIDVRDTRALDAGASTGGFTDCLLQRGARAVVAVDVGHGLLHERLVDDDRVRSLERTNVRDLDGSVAGAFDLVVADLSFISLELVLDALIGVCRPGGLLIVLVKPQFEARRDEADRTKGVITDPTIWRRVLEEVITAVRRRAAVIMGAMASPITGAQGNVEFWLLARVAGPVDRRGRDAAVDLDAVLAEATGGPA
jgi:23S rRNA (cytidine1920-2'-O)/16S rRNA (cytidine1409-2'-O)-methyltransferase